MIELTVLKYEISPGTNLIKMEQGAKLLAVQMQRHRSFLWAQVNPAAPLTVRQIVVCGTGRLSPDRPYIGTYQDNEYVWHAFDGGELPLK